MEAAGRLDLLGNRRQKELCVGSIEAGREEVGALAGIEIVNELTVEHDFTTHLGGAQPRDEPVIAWTRVVLPAPDRPEIPIDCPGSSAKSRPWRTGRASPARRTLKSFTSRLTLPFGCFRREKDT